MPVRPTHHLERFLNGVYRDVLVEHVAHGIDEDSLWLLPMERVVECGWVDREGKTVSVLLLAHSLKPVGEAICITIFAAWTNVCTARNWVPGCVCPLDMGCRAHDAIVSPVFLNGGRLEPDQGPVVFTATCLVGEIL